MLLHSILQLDLVITSLVNNIVNILVKPIINASNIIFLYIYIYQHLILLLKEEGEKDSEGVVVSIIVDKSSQVSFIFVLLVVK